jgi:hypothetical protein
MISVFSRQNILAIFPLVMLSLPGLARAADNSSKPEAAVPPVTYRSVFRETSLGVELDKIDWRKANDDVGKFTRGHVDIIKQEQMDSKAMEDKKSMESKPMPQAATPSTTPTTAPKPAPTPAKPAPAPAQHKH